MQENKKTTSKKKVTISMWTLIVVVVFILSVGIYVFFNRSYEVIDFPNLKLLEKAKHNKAPPDDTIVPDMNRYTAKDCYEGNYLRILYLISSLYIEFYKDHNILDRVNVIENTNLYDAYLDQAVQYLKTLILNCGSKTTIAEIREEFEEVRIKIARANHKQEFEHSPLISGLFNVISIYRKGDKAIEVGGVDEKMEYAYRALVKDNVEEAYNIVLSLDDKLKSQAGDWLKRTACFIRVQEVVAELRRYVYSERYSGKFKKNCGS